MSDQNMYVIDGKKYPRVTHILADMGFIDSRFFTEEGRTRGTYVHKACEYDDMERLDESTIDDTIAPYLSGWRAFKRESGVVIHELEKTVYSELYRYAGTLDRIATINGSRAILDIKTGAIERATGLQLAAYEEALGEKSLKRYAVHLTNTGGYSLVPYKDRAERGVFLSAVTCYHWKYKERS